MVRDSTLDARQLHDTSLCLIFPAQLFNPNMAGLFRGSFCGAGEGGLNYPHLTCLIKFVRIMVETWNLLLSIHTYIVLENIAFSAKSFLILLMPAFYLQKISIFLQM